jgi:drug/metabolite transporter (DMT)-like permease
VAIAPAALALVLAAAGFHAAWNLLLHDTSDRVAAMAIAGLAAGVALFPFALALPPWHVLPLIILSALAETAYALCLSAAYRRGALAVAYPLGRGVSPLLVTLGGWIVLSQPPAPLALGGAALLACGLAVIATAGRRAGQMAAVGFAVLTGCAIASYSLVDARAVQQVFPLAYVGPVFVLQGALLVGVMRGNRARLRQALRPGLLIAVGSTAAYVLVLFAFQLAPAGRVSTLREVSVLIGMYFAREKAGWRLWAGAVLVVGGMVLTAF